MMNFSQKFSLSQTVFPIDFETTSSTQPDDYEDKQEYFNFPEMKETTDGEVMSQQSSIPVVGPQTPWRYVPKIIPSARTLPPPPPQPGAFMKGKHTGLHHNYLLSLETS